MRDTIEFKCGIELYWPKITIRKDCVGIWPKTVIVWRRDGNGWYKWGFAIRILGFGIAYVNGKPKEET